MASIDNVNDKQLVAGYLRGKPRSRSMHAATIKEHIKCTGYCRRDPYRQLLVSCCQPRRWTSRTYSYTGCFASNRFFKLTKKTYDFSWNSTNILIFFNSHLIHKIDIYKLFRRFLFRDTLSRNFDRSNRDFNFLGNNRNICAYSFYSISKSVHKVSIFTEHFHYELLQTIGYK